jgi:hypothetical protein
MTNVSSVNDSASRLMTQADIMGRLAKDAGAFAAVVAAFESKDPDAFRWVLDRLGFLPHCELICEWVRVKLGVLRCVDVCGIPEREAKTPSLKQFAHAIVRLASNEALLRRVVDAVSCSDADAYRAAIGELKLEEFCYLICHWVWVTVYHPVCEVICVPKPVIFPDPLREIQAAAKVMDVAMAKEKAFDAIGNATMAGDCKLLQSTVNEAGFTSECEILCRVICSWRYVWVCRQLCVRAPPILGQTFGIEEARDFALAARQLASQPRALGDLISAVQTRDANSYAQIVARFGLGPYCSQVCGWVCSVTCREFCECVCLPPGLIIPLFTQVGCYNVGPTPTSDFNPNGTTTSGSLAFTGTIPLMGLIPDGTASQAIQYRFTYQDYSAVSPNPNPVVPITGAMVPATIIGQIEFSYWNGTSWQPGVSPYYVNNPGATASIPQEFGPPLSVSVNTDTDAQGWIQVPRLADSSPGGTGLFTPDTAQGLILLDTTQLTNEVFDLTGASPLLPRLNAGDAMPAAALSAKPVFQINFEAQTVSTSAPVGSNSLNAIALSNTTYKYIRHPEWPGPLPPPPSPITTSPLVLSLDILELDTGGGCTRLDDTIHSLYTAYHPYLGSCEVFLQGPGVASMTTPPGGNTNLVPVNISSGPAGQPFDMTNLQPCGYIMWLQATLNLTSGLACCGPAYGTLSDYIPFCTTNPGGT